MNTELITLAGLFVLFALIAGGFALGYRFLETQERRTRGEARSSTPKATTGGGTKIEIHTAPENPDGDRQGGFQYFDVNDLERRTFIDAFNGFKNYAELRGYSVDVYLDTSRSGKVGLKITIRDAGVTVSTSQVRQDVNDYIRRMRERDDLGDMPFVIDPVEHSRLVAAIKMRFDFIRNQAEMSATATEAYKAILATMVKQGVGAISYLPASSVPTIHVQIGTEGGKATSNTFSADQSPGAAIGTHNTAAVTESSVAIGGTASARNEQTAALDNLLMQIRTSDLDLDQKEEASRNLANVKDELGEFKPDKDRIARWLNRAREIIKVGAAGAELIERGNEVFRMFGGCG